MCVSVNCSQMLRRDNLEALSPKRAISILYCLHATTNAFYGITQDKGH